MSAHGNDFIIINNMELTLNSQRLSELARKLCRRRVSIGADGILVIEPPGSSQASFTMRIFNADGSEGEMCGNGARCIAWYAYSKGIAPQEMIIDTISGSIKAWVNGKNVRILLTQPTKIELEKNIETSKGIINCSYIELGYPGIPHAVIKHQEVSKKNFLKLMNSLKEFAREIRHNKAFPKGANVNFYNIINNEVHVLTYERGVEDFTLACGTGIASVVVALVKKGILSLDNQNKAHVVVPGGELSIVLEFDKDQIRNIYLEGEVRCIAEGILYEDTLL